MSWTRCTQCGTHLDSARFPRCCICGHDLSSTPAAAAGGASQSPGGAPEAPQPEVEAESARDQTASRGVSGLGILLGLGGIGSVVVSGSGGQGEMVSLGVGGLIVTLIVLALYGAGGKAAKDPVRTQVGRVAGSALATIAITIAGLGVLATLGVVLFFVACITGAAGSGFGS